MTNNPQNCLGEVDYVIVYILFVDSKNDSKVLTDNPYLYSSLKVGFAIIADIRKSFNE